MASTNSINDIEKWVAGQLRVIRIKGNSVLEVKKDVPIPTPQLAGWQMYTTSGNENDCMIHALLTDCSPTFRTLDIDTKNTIASTYRRGNGSSSAPFLQIVTKYYQDHPNIPVNQGGRSANLVGKARIDFLTDLIRGSEFLRQEFLTPICYYYNINVLIYATNRPGEVGLAATTSKVVFEFEPQPDLIENAPAIVMHNGYSIHFSAMSRTDGRTFIMPYADVAAIKDEMDELIKKEQPKATLKCIYKDGNIFYDNSGKQWIVQDITYTSGYGDLNCIALRIQNFETSEVLNNVPLNFFQKISNDDLRFDKTAYDASIRSGRVPSSPINPSNPPPKPPKPSPQKKPISIPDLLPKSTLTPDKELSAYFENGKIKAEFDTNTGFSETLGPTRNDPAAPKTGSFWEEKIIEIIDGYKKQRQINLAKYNDDDPIFNNYPEFKKNQLDNTGKIIVPSIDEDRVRDYTNSEQEFNQVMKALQGRIVKIKAMKVGLDANNLYTNNQLSILTSMLEYPQSSQLENYFLIFAFLDDRTINDIFDLFFKNIYKEKEPEKPPPPPPEEPGNQPEKPNCKGGNPILKPAIHYLSIMGLQYNLESLTLKELNTQYRKQSLVIHPDKNPKKPNASKEFAEFKNTYEIIRDNELYEKAGREKWDECFNLWQAYNYKYERWDKKVTELRNWKNKYNYQEWLKKNKQWNDWHRNFNKFYNKFKQLKPRNFVVLLVLLARNSKDGYIFSNKWKGLYEKLFYIFHNTLDDSEFDLLSEKIVDAFTEFLKSNGDLITEDFLRKIVDGIEMYKIYESNYEDSLSLRSLNSDDTSKMTKVLEESKQEFKNRKAQFALPRKLIQDRTKAWLEMSYKNVRTTPTSFIFDRYTEEEKKFMIQENAICKEISELTGKLGKTNIPQMQLPSDFFVKPSSGTDKLSSFLEETGPNVTKSIQNERRRMFFEGRGPYVRGGGRKTRNVKRVLKKRKTRSKRI